MPCKQTFLSTGDLLGKQKGVHFLGLLREMRKYILVPLLDLEVTKILSLSEALASLRHTYPDSFFLDPEDIRKRSIGVI